MTNPSYSHFDKYIYEIYTNGTRSMGSRSSVPPSKSGEFLEFRGKYLPEKGKQIAALLRSVLVDLALIEPPEMTFDDVDRREVR